VFGVASGRPFNNPLGGHALQRGMQDGIAAAGVVFQAGERGIMREEIEHRGGVHWDEHYAASGEVGPILAGSREEYVLMFRVAFEGVLEQSMPQEVHAPSMDVGDTPEALRQHFDAPDLDLPEDVVRVEVEMARHIRSEEPFHLLGRAKEFSGPRWKNPTSSPILACASLTLGSTLVPTIRQGGVGKRTIMAWARVQYILPAQAIGCAAAASYARRLCPTAVHAAVGAVRLRAGHHPGFVTR